MRAVLMSSEDVRIESLHLFNVRVLFLVLHIFWFLQCLCHFQYITKFYLTVII
jgi:hypothetical protein